MSDDLPPRTPSRRPPEKHSTPVGVWVMYAVLVAVLAYFVYMAYEAYAG